MSYGITWRKQKIGKEQKKWKLIKSSKFTLDIFKMVRVLEDKSRPMFHKVEQKEKAVNVVTYPLAIFLFIKISQPLRI